MQLRGSMPALITPFRNGEVDLDSYKKLIARQLEKGSHGILVNGTTSEPSTLSLEERNLIVKTAKQLVGDSLPIVAATGSGSLAESRALSLYAASQNVAALLIVTPYYIKPPQRGLIEYFLKVTDGLDIPWMLYHIPGRSAVHVTADTIGQLRERSSTFIGLKHASLDLSLVSTCLKLYPNLAFFAGIEEMSFPMLALGAKGLMSAVGNICPHMLVQLVEAMWENNILKARKLHEQLLELNQAIFYETNPIPIKYMMKRLGIIAENEHRLPMLPASKETMKKLDKLLEQSKFLPE